MPVLPIVPGWPILAVAPTLPVAAPPHSAVAPIDWLDSCTLLIPGALTDFEAHQGAGTIRRYAKNGGFELAEVTGPGLSAGLGIAPAVLPRSHVRAGAAGVRVAVFSSGELAERGSSWV
jgi:hypothetical protein